MDWYNGFSPAQRNAMGRAVAPSFTREPPCAMCGDPSPTKMQTHAEDYSMPSTWLPPAVYPLCVRCHSRLHSRFAAPLRWQSFLAFLRRGWYGREVSSVELNRLTRLGDTYTWTTLPHTAPTRSSSNSWWWESLTMDESSKQPSTVATRR